MKNQMVNDISSAMKMILSICEELEHDVKRVLMPNERLSEMESNLTREMNHTLMQKLTNLQSKLGKLQEERESKMEALTFKFDQLHGLYNLLGMAAELDFSEIGPKLTEERVTAFDERIRELTVTKINREREIKVVLEEVKGLWEEMELPQAGEFTTDFERSVSEGVESLGLSMDAIEQLSAYVQDLLNLKREREDILRSLGKQVSALWKTLKVPEEERVAFFEKNNGIGLSVIGACERELGRLSDLKREKLEVLIEECRHSIVALMDECCVPENERQTVKVMEVLPGDYNDQVLADHEREVDLLMTRREEMQPLLKIIKKREDILVAREEYEAIIKDSSRLLSRRAGKDLIHERELEKQVKRLPKVEEQLLALLEGWEEKHGVLLVSGVPYLDKLHEECKARDNEKLLEKELKANSKKGDKEAAGQSKAAMPIVNYVAMASDARTASTRKSSQPAAVGKDIREKENMSLVKPSLATGNSTGSFIPSRHTSSRDNLLPKKMVFDE